MIRAVFAAITNADGAAVGFVWVDGDAVDARSKAAFRSGGLRDAQKC
jgi:hypothetical protein